MEIRTPSPGERLRQTGDPGQAKTNYEYDEIAGYTKLLLNSYKAKTEMQEDGMKEAAVLVSTGADLLIEIVLTNLPVLTLPVQKGKINFDEKEVLILSTMLTQEDRAIFPVLRVLIRVHLVVGKAKNTLPNAKYLWLFISFNLLWL